MSEAGHASLLLEAVLRQARDGVFQRLLVLVGEHALVVMTLTVQHQRLLQLLRHGAAGSRPRRRMGVRGEETVSGTLLGYRSSCPRKGKEVL